MIGASARHYAPAPAARKKSLGPRWTEAIGSQAASAAVDARAVLRASSGTAPPTGRCA